MEPCLIYLAWHLFGCALNPFPRRRGVQRGTRQANAGEFEPHAEGRRVQRGAGGQRREGWMGEPLGVVSSPPP